MKMDQTTPAPTMKLLRGEHKYKNYGELCAALGLVPAKRGKDRDLQKAEISQQYIITEHKNGTFTIEKLNKAIRRESAMAEKQQNGTVVKIDGHEVNILSNRCYQHTMIDKYIDCTIFRVAKRIKENEFGAYDESLTSMTNIWSCVFSRTKMYKELLKHIGTEGYNDIPRESLQYFHSVIMSSLYNKVKARLLYLESRGWITVQHMYRIGQRGNSHIEYVDAEEVQPSIDYALRILKLRTVGQAMGGAKRDEFIKIRNDHFNKQTGKKLGAKVMEISSNIPDYSVDDDTCDDDELPCTELSNRDIQIILTAFFDVFRARHLKKIDERAAHFGEIRNNEYGLVTLQTAGKTKELISTYCAYATTTGWAGDDKNSEESVAFYSLDELVEYYELNLNDPVLTVDFSDLVKCKTYTCDWVPPEEQQAEQFLESNWDMTDDDDDIPAFNSKIHISSRYYAIGNFLSLDFDDYDDY